MTIHRWLPVPHPRPDFVRFRGGVGPLPLSLRLWRALWLDVFDRPGGAIAHP